MERDQQEFEHIDNIIGSVSFRTFLNAFCNPCNYGIKFSNVTFKSIMQNMPKETSEQLILLYDFIKLLPSVSLILEPVMSKNSFFYITNFYEYGGAIHSK